MGRIESRVEHPEFIPASYDFSGSGSANAIAIWQDASTLSFDANLGYSSGALNIVAPDTDHGVLNLFASSTTGTVRQYWKNSDATRAFEFDADFTGSAEQFIFQSDSTTIFGITRAGQIWMYAVGSQAAPAYSFGADAASKASGMWWSAGVRFSHNNVLTAIFSGTGCHLLGTTTNDNATAGNVGQHTESVGTDAVFNPGTDVFSDLGSLSLTAGDWDVTGFAGFYNNPSLTYISVFIGLVSGNNQTGQLYGNNGVLMFSAAGVNETVMGSIPVYRMSLAATTTVYLKAAIGYPSGTPHVVGWRISARRVR